MTGSAEQEMKTRRGRQQNIVLKVVISRGIGERYSTLNGGPATRILRTYPAHYDRLANRG